MTFWWTDSRHNHTAAFLVVAKHNGTHNEPLSRDILEDPKWKRGLLADLKEICACSITLLSKKVFSTFWNLKERDPS